MSPGRVRGAEHIRRDKAPRTKQFPSRERQSPRIDRHEDIILPKHIQTHAQQNGNDARALLYGTILDNFELPNVLTEDFTKNSEDI
jgi:hypothetical protein